MSEPVNSDKIEAIVGHERCQSVHLGRAVEAEKTFYILHPYECLNTYEDLTQCPYSLAMDRGLTFESFELQILGYNQQGLVATESRGEWEIELMDV